MDLSRLGSGERIAVISAAVLVISMLVFGWFSINGAKFEDTDSGQKLELNEDDIKQAAEDAGEDTTRTAFEAFSIIDILLVIAAVVVIGGVALRMRGNPAAGNIGPIVAAAAAAAFLLVLFRTVFPPDLIGSLGGADPPDNIEVDTDVGRGIGVFIGLIASAGMAYGTYLMMGDQTPASRTQVSPPPPAPAEPGTEQGPQR